MSGFYTMIGTLGAGLLSAGASAYGANKASQNARDLQKSQQPYLDAQLANQKLLGQYGPQFLNQGEQNMGVVSSYLNKLMSGDRGTTLSALAPEINSLTQQYQGAINAQRGLQPRGGVAAAQAAQLPYNLQGNINNLIFSARPQAAQQLGQLGGQQASLGLGALGQNVGLTNNMLNYGLNAQNQMFGQGMAIGQGISSFISPLLQYYMYNNMGRGNSNSSSPYLPSSNNYFGYSLAPGPNQTSASPYSYPNTNFSPLSGLGYSS